MISNCARLVAAGPVVTPNLDHSCEVGQGSPICLRILPGLVDCLDHQAFFETSR